MFMELVRKRRSTRRFQDRALERGKLNLLIEAALRAPSSHGYNPWEFIVVEDRSLLDKLSAAKPHGSAFLKLSAAGIVVCGDREKSDMWIEDTSIASTYIQLAAESLDLGSCWIQIRDRNHDDGRSAGEYVADLLDLPQRLQVESIIAVGYPDGVKPPHGQDYPQYGKVHGERYGSPFMTG